MSLTLWSELPDARKAQYLGAQVVRTAKVAGVNRRCCMRDCLLHQATKKRGACKCCEIQVGQEYQQHAGQGDRIAHVQCVVANFSGKPIKPKSTRSRSSRSLELKYTELDLERARTLYFEKGFREGQSSALSGIPEMVEEALDRRKV